MGLFDFITQPIEQITEVVENVRTGIGITTGIALPAIVLVGGTVLATQKKPLSYLGMGAMAIGGVMLVKAVLDLTGERAAAAEAEVEWRRTAATRETVQAQVWLTDTGYLQETTVAAIPVAEMLALNPVYIGETGYLNVPTEYSVTEYVSVADMNEDDKNLLRELGLI